MLCVIKIFRPMAIDVYRVRNFLKNVKVSLIFDFTRIRYCADVSIFVIFDWKKKDPLVSLTRPFLLLIENQSQPGNLAQFSVLYSNLRISSQIDENIVGRIRDTNLAK